jgi:nucleotide-binding universal stress UspA family protein
MLVDVRAFFQGFDTLIFAATLVFVALLSKYIAAFVMQLLYRYTRAERLLFFGLSCSHAAATIAVVIVGYRMGIFDEQIINGTVLIILFTCLISTYLTDYAGRLVALQQKRHDVKEHESYHVMVPVSNPETALTLFDFAIMISQPNGSSSVSPITIATNAQQLEQSILKDKSFADYFINQANAANVRYMPAMRIDSNISEGIIHAAMEIQVTHIVLGWSGQSGTAKYFFGTIIEKLLENCPQTLAVVNMRTKILMFRKIYVLIPRNAGHEAGFKAWMLLLYTLQRNISGELLFIADKDTAESIAGMNKSMSFPEKNVGFLTETPNMQAIAGELKENDLLVVVLARPNTVSYSRKLAVMPRVITRYFSHTNSMILYPEQMDILHDKIDINFGII